MDGGGGMGDDDSLKDSGSLLVNVSLMSNIDVMETHNSAMKRIEQNVLLFNDSIEVVLMT